MSDPVTREISDVEFERQLRTVHGRIAFYPVVNLSGCDWHLREVARRAGTVRDRKIAAELREDVDALLERRLWLTMCQPVRSDDS